MSTNHRSNGPRPPARKPRPFLAGILVEVGVIVALVAGLFLFVWQAFALYRGEPSPFAAASPATKGQP